MREGRTICLQCVCEAETWGEVIPGWHVMISKKYHEDWPDGWIGLVQSNDPSVIFDPWEIEVLTDPYFDDPDEGDPIWKDKAISDQFDKFIDSASEFEQLLEGPPEFGYDLVRSASKVGYNRDESGSFSIWLFHKISELILTKVPKFHGKD